MIKVLYLTLFIPALSLLLGAIVPDVFETSVYSMMDILFSSLGMFAQLLPVTIIGYLLVTTVAVYVSYWSYGGIEWLIRTFRY